MQPRLPVLTALACAASLLGCASTSGEAYSQLDRSRPEYHSEQCQGAIRDIEVHDGLKLVRSVVSPVAVVLSGGAEQPRDLQLSGGMLLPAVFAANVGLDTVDRVDASKMEVVCGGEGKSAEQIATGVVKGAAFGLATGAAGNAVGASGLPMSGSSK